MTKKEDKLLDKKVQNSKPRSILKRTLDWLITPTGMETSAVIGKNIIGPKTYSAIFKRYERPDNSLKPGMYCHDRLKDQLPRTNIPYLSDGIQLMGHYYKPENPKSLVVISHGIHAGGDDCLWQISSSKIVSVSFHTITKELMIPREIPLLASVSLWLIWTTHSSS